MDVWADLVVSLVSLAIVAAHAWALRGHFTSTTMPFGAKLITTLVGVSTVIYLYLTWVLAQPLAASIAGVVIELPSAALFFAAIRASRRASLRYAFDPEKPRTLVDSGPYGVVRHPFYVSYILFWLGWTIAVWSPFALLNLAILIVLYVVAARTEERNFAGSALASEYEHYRRRVGFFWPRLG